MPSVVISWTIEWARPHLCGWHVYASPVREAKGKLIALATADQTSAEVELPEGTWWIRVLSVTRGCGEESWQGSAHVQQVRVRPRGETPPTITGRAAGVEPHSILAVVLEPPEVFDVPHLVEVIEGPDQYRGKLLDRVKVEPGGPYHLGFALALKGIPLEGIDGGRDIHLRGINPGGTPGAVTSSEVTAPARPGFTPTTLASVAGSTLVGFSAPTGGLPIEVDATDGVRLKAMPAQNDSTAWTALGAKSGWTLDAQRVAPYFQFGTFTSDELDLGSDTTFVLEIADELQRKTAAGAWASRAKEDMVRAPVMTADIDHEDYRYQTERHPGFLWRSIDKEGRPIRPITDCYWEYDVSDTASFTPSWKRYVPGMYVSGRYVRVRLQLREPLGWHQLICPNLTVKALVPKTVVTDHGGLSGLSDDDHTQYLKTDGSRTATGNLDATGYEVSGTQVVGAQETSVSDLSSLPSLSGSDTVDLADLNLYLDEIRTQVNALLSRLRSHGLIAP